MNRRAFIKTSAAIGGTITFGTFGRETAAQTAPIVVERQWGMSAEYTDSLEKFFTTITACGTEDEAEAAFAELRDAESSETMYDAGTGAETFGDESFFVEYNLPYLITFEATVRIGTLIYEFRWEGPHWGSMRDGHRVMESVLDRAEPRETYTGEDLLQRLPTADEVATYGLDVLEADGAAPAA